MIDLIIMMKKWIYHLFCTFFFCRLFSIELCQFDFDLGVESYQTDHFWNKNGKRKQTFNHFKFREVRGYVDVYPSQIDCISFSGSYIQIEEEINGNGRGFSDSELTWTRFFYVNGPHSLASQITAIIPSGSQIYNLRYGEFGGQFDLLYSTSSSFFDHSFFFDSKLGYRMYKGFPSDQIRAFASLGSYFLNLCPKLYLDASLDLQYGVFNGKSKFNYPLILLNPNYRLLQGDIRLSYQVSEHLYFSAGAFQHLWGQNVGTGGGYFIEGWLQY